MFKRLLFASIAFAVGLATLPAGAATKLSDKPSAAEMPFVRSVQRTLSALYPTPAAAEKAGYFRFTNEDRTGSISYVNPSHWTSDLKHPSQLWYDVHGRLLGADYTVPMARHAHKPAMWGIDPQRWHRFPAHVHWVLRLPNGKYEYELMTSVEKYEDAGGNVEHPTAAPIVKLGKASSAGEVAHVFAFPNLWDLELWVLRNPNGAFAYMNPRVHPSKSAGMGGM